MKKIIEKIKKFWNSKPVLFFVSFFTFVALVLSLVDCFSEETAHGILALLLIIPVAPYVIKKAKQLSSSDKPYIYRLKQERKELGARKEKLSNFILSEVFSNLSDEDQQLLKNQLTAMKEYYDILIERLK
ncbi:MAG: hypothetical protein LBM67_08420 [Lentimicrobiaceae bacterium]|jgi:hypothetical protein|nr:hypothetical protein [Lentimicrobiaceae bacterium]